MKYLIPVDGSDLALDALRHALRLVAEGLQASFVLANVQETPHLYEVVLAPDIEVLEGASRSAGAHALESAEALLQAAGQDYECEVVSGDPGHALIDVAERYGCDGIIIAARGLGGLSSMLLGSVSSAVVHAAAIPVTVVRRAEEENYASAEDEEDADLAAS